MDLVAFCALQDNAAPWFRTWEGLRSADTTLKELVAETWILGHR